ncbi:phage tail tape measure protein [Terrisporobacter glycolicus]|uniref:Phage tail tape measure protein domain-containing protein n=1 Tax=Terrisporobacter glycolicus ATCC 14880 = DSM 1288 TaxID=1121315 RepID=A0ABZ2EWP9_9FIRM|nr:phage tail tape measure protein [Terrisporobacter glycolicus]
MSDGQIIIDTALDSKGIEQGIKELSGIANKGLKGLLDQFSKISPTAKTATLGVSALVAGFKAFHQLGTTALKEVGGALSSIGSIALDVGKQIWDSLAQIGQFPTSINDVISEYTSYNSTMKEVEAISGATKEEFKQLLDVTAKLGRETQFTATNAAEGLKYMAMAGWSAKESMDGLPSVLRLAQIGSADLGTTSDIVTDTITAMGMSATDCGDMVDMFAATITKSNTTVEMMGETMTYVAPIAGSLGVQFEDLALATGLLANVGIKASISGTSLRTMLTNLASPTDKAATTMKKYGISMKETNDGSVDLDATMQNLRKSLSSLPLKKQAEAAKNLFGKTGMAGGLAIINASESDYKNLKTAIEGSTESMTYWKKECEKAGMTEEQTAKRLDELHNVFTESKDMADALNISSTDLTKSISLLGKDGKVTSGNIENLFTVFNKLNNATEEQKVLMKKYGIELVKNDDNSLNYDKSLKNIVTSLRDKTDAEREAILTGLDLAGSIEEINELCALTPNEFNKTIKAIEETQSAAEKAQKIIDESLKGSIMRLGSALSGLGLSIMSECAPALGKFCDLMAESATLLLNGDVDGAVTKFTKGLKSEFKNIPKIMSNAFKGIESFVVKQGPKLFDAGSSLLKNICKGITGNKKSISGALDSAVKQGAEFISKNAPDLGDAAISIIDSLSKSFDKNKGDIGDALYKATNEAVKVYLETKKLEWKVKINLIPQIVLGAMETGNATTKAEDSGNSPLGFSGAKEDYAGTKSLKDWFEDLLSAITPKADAAEIENEGKKVGEKVVNGAKDGAITSIQDATKEIQQSATNMYNGAKTSFSKLAEVGTQSASQMYNGMRTSFTSLASVGKQSMTDMYNGCKTSLSGLRNIGTTQMISLKNVTRTQSTEARNAFTTQFISLRKVASTQSKEARDAVTTQMISMKKVVSTQSREARNAFTTQMISIKNVARVQSQEAGRYIATGLASGIRSGTSSAVSAARSMVAQVNAIVKSVAKINSPSKVTTEYGEFYAEGLGVGIKNKTPELYKTAMNQIQGLNNRMKSAVNAEMSRIYVSANANSTSNIKSYNTTEARLNNEDIERLGEALSSRPNIMKTIIGEKEIIEVVAEPVRKHIAKSDERNKRKKGDS